MYNLIARNQDPRNKILDQSNIILNSLSKSRKIPVLLFPELRLSQFEAVDDFSRKSTRFYSAEIGLFLCEFLLENILELLIFFIFQNKTQLCDRCEGVCEIDEGSRILIVYF